MVLTISVLLLAFALGVEVLFVQHLRSEFDRTLLAKAQSLSALLEQDEEGVDFDFTPETMPEFGAGPSAEYFELWLAGWSHSERAAALGAHELPRFEQRTLQPRYRDLLLPDGRAGRAVQLDFLPRLDPKERLDPAQVKRPPATLVAARDRSQLEQLINGLRTALALLVCSGIVIAAYLVRRTVHHGLLPLKVIRAQLANLHATTLHARLTLPDNAAELAPLVAQFNILLADLEDAFRREQEFAVAAAHELRTPLAEIRSLAEVGARFADDRALTREYFTDIVAAVTQLETLARNLLALARHDSSNADELQLETIDVVAAVHQTWRALASSAAARQLQLRYGGPDAVCIRCDGNTLDLLLRNVVGNAVAHSPAGATITIECDIDHAGVTLTVANPAGPLLASDLPHLFERFWRKDAARRDDGHAGLGLALVRASATRLGVQSTARVDDEGQFVLQLAGFKAVATGA